MSSRVADGFYSLASAALVIGRHDEARGLGDRMLEFVPGNPSHAAYASQLVADIAAHPALFDGEGAEAHYREALALAEPRRMRPLIAHCHFGLGKLHRRTGKRDQARQHLTAATTMYREMEMRFWLEQAEAVLHGVGGRPWGTATRLQNRATVRHSGRIEPSRSAVERFPQRRHFVDRVRWWQGKS
jgi:tetratricopeptide (TPR) repeat protein